MKHFRSWALAPLLLLACSSGSPPTGSSPSVTTPRPADDGGAGVLAEAGAPAVEATTRLEPEGTCDPLATPSSPVADVGGAPVPPLARIVRVGARWAAGGEDLGGFLTFADDGSAASALVSVGSFDFAAKGDALRVFSATYADLAFQVFDQQGAPISKRQPLAAVKANAPPRLSAAQSSTRSIAVWSEEVRLRGVVLDGGGLPGATFEIPGVVHGHATAAMGDRFALVWSGEHEGGPALWRAFATSAGLEGPPAVIVDTQVPRDVLRVVATASGLAVLLSGQHHAEVLALDASGAFRLPLVQFAGLRAGWDLAADGDRLLLAATRSDRRAAIRPLHDDGAPAGNWLCLTAPDGPTDAVAVAAVSPGWVVTFREAGDRQRLARLDAIPR